MNSLRYIVTFILLVVVTVLAIFQMPLRGYEKVGRINEYVLYYKGTEACESHIITIDDVTYNIECESQYLLTSGFAEYTIIEGLEEELVTIHELEDDLTISIE